MSAFPACWCGCPPARHKVEPVKGQLRHTRCQRCRCTQYEPRVEEAALPAPDEEETAAAEDLALMREAGLTYRPDQTVALVDAEERVWDGTPGPLPPVPEQAYPPDAVPLPAAVVPAPPKPSGTLHPPPLVHGQRLGWWDAYQCLTCGSRTFLHGDCCGADTTPVTVTVTFREVPHA